MKNTKYTNSYKKYVQPEIDRQKRREKKERSEWIWSKGFLLFNTLLSLIAAVASVIALLK